MPLQSRRQQSSSNALHFLKHVYDPMDEDIRRIFPNYTRWSQGQWLEKYQNDRPNEAAEVAAFALAKLQGVTTSYRLTEAQRINLERLAAGRATINTNLFGYAGYCNTLSARQLEYVGW